MFCKCRATRETPAAALACCAYDTYCRNWWFCCYSTSWHGAVFAMSDLRDAKIKIKFVPGGCHIQRLVLKYEVSAWEIVTRARSHALNTCPQATFGCFVFAFPENSKMGWLSERLDGKLFSKFALDVNKSWCVCMNDTVGSHLASIPASGITCEKYCAVNHDLQGEFTKRIGSSLGA